MVAGLAAAQTQKEKEGSCFLSNCFQRQDLHSCLSFSLAVSRCLPPPLPFTFSIGNISLETFLKHACEAKKEVGDGLKELTCHCEIKYA